MTRCHFASHGSRGDGRLGESSPTHRQIDQADGGSSDDDEVESVTASCHRVKKLSVVPSHPR